MWWLLFVELVLTSNLYPLGVSLPIFLYLRGVRLQEGIRVGYNMIPVKTLSQLAYFTYIFIDIIIYTLGSMPWSSRIF
jgi:hypothetical protein